MSTLNALDLSATFPAMSHARFNGHTQSFASSTFSLTCAVEVFESVAGSRFKALSEALASSAFRLFAVVNEGPTTLNVKALEDPQYIPKLFQRFENIFVCINEMQFEINSQGWRVEIAWRNVQDHYKMTRAALVRKVAR